MERLFHRLGPTVPIFGSPRSQGTSYLWASGGAVKRRLLRRAGAAAATFGLIMAVAHIGPTTLWIAVVKVAVALGIFAGRWRCPAGQRRRPWSSRPRSLAASRTPYRRCRRSAQGTCSGVLSRSAVTSAPSRRVHSSRPAPTPAARFWSRQGDHQPPPEAWDLRLCGLRPWALPGLPEVGQVDKYRS